MQVLLKNVKQAQALCILSLCNSDPVCSLLHAQCLEMDGLDRLQGANVQSILSIQGVVRFEFCAKVC